MNDSIPDTKNKFGAVFIVTILVTLIFLSSFLRLWNLGGATLWIDEGFTIGAAQATQKTGLPILESGKPYQVHTGDIYATAASLFLGTFDPQNPWQARLPSAIFGILSIFATYFFTYASYKRKDIAMLSAFLVAFSFWELAWSRQARGYTMMQFFSLLSMGFFISWLRAKKFVHILIALFFFIAAFLGQSLFIIFLPVYVGVSLLSLSESDNKKRWFLFALLATGVILLCGVASFLKIFSSSIIIDFQPEFLVYIVRTYPILVLFSVISLFSGFFNDKIRLPAMEGTVIILFPLIVLTFFSPAIQMRYLLIIFPFLIIQGAAGLCVIVRYLFKRTFSKSLLISYSLIFGFGCMAFGNYINFLPYTYYRLEPGSPQPAFNLAYKFIHQKKTEGDLVISPYASMTNIYLGYPGLLLPISLSGRTSDLNATTVGGIDYYTGAPALLDLEYFKSILETKNGFIVLDTMARMRIKKTYLPIIESLPGVKKVFENKSASDTIQVFKFEPIPTPIAKPEKINVSQ